MDLSVLPADILFTASDTFVGRAIRWATEVGREGPSIYNHAACFVRPDGDFRQSDIIEAVGHGVRFDRFEFLYPVLPPSFAIATPLTLTNNNRWAICNYMASEVGRSYGISKIARFLGDALVSKVAGVDIDFFRKGIKNQLKPICSSLVASAYSSVGLTFGKNPYYASPDDMWDFVINNKDKYQVKYIKVS